MVPLSDPLSQPSPPHPQHQWRQVQVWTALWEALGAKDTSASETKWMALHHIQGCWGGPEEAGRHPRIEDSIYQVKHVHWAKLQLVLPEFPVLYGPELGLTAGEICMRIGRER